MLSLSVALSYSLSFSLSLSLFLFLSLRLSFSGIIRQHSLKAWRILIYSIISVSSCMCLSGSIYLHDYVCLCISLPLDFSNGCM